MQRFRSAFHVLPKIYNSATGKWENYEGTEGHSGLITKYKSCTTAAETITTITAGKKGYVTALIMHNSHTVDQGITIADTSGTKLKIKMSTDDWTAILKEKPFLVLEPGAVTGDAKTGGSFNITLTYYER